MNRRESGIIPSSYFFFFLVVDYVFRESENVCIFFLAVIFYLEIQMMNKFGPETKKISHFLLVLDSCFIFLLSKSKVQQAAKKVFQQILSSLQHTV